MKRGEASRTRILATARDTLATRGLEGFVMREIAKRAVMQLGNLQYYFPTRGDLLEAVIRTEFEHNLATIRSLRYVRLARRLLVSKTISISFRISCYRSTPASAVISGRS